MGELAPVENLKPLFVEKGGSVKGFTSPDAGIAHDIYAIGEARHIYLRFFLGKCLSL